MILPDHIQDTYTAGQEWLKRKLEKDEITLEDYQRPLCKDTMVRPKRNTVPWFKYLIV
jgi:hypothetical protein